MGKLLEIRVQSDDSVEVRTETWLDREYRVFPLVALVEGVLQGALADEPEFCPLSTISKAPAGWNGRPAVMNHPQVDGVYVSANSPQVLSDWQVGWIFNSRIDGTKLIQEAWIDVARCKELGGDAETTLQRLDDGLKVEVSTGLFVSTKSGFGVHNGRQYKQVWDEITPDHLALLSEGVLGACSIADGCGANRVNHTPQQTAALQGAQLRANVEGLRTIHTHEGSCGSGCECDTCKGITQETPDVEASNKKRMKPYQQMMARPNKMVQRFLDGLSVNAMPSGVLFTDITNILSEAISDYFTGMYCWVISATSDVVVFNCVDDNWGIDTYQIAYSMDADGNVT